MIIDTKQNKEIYFRNRDKHEIDVLIYTYVQSENKSIHGEVFLGIITKVSKIISHYLQYVHDWN